ncbi:hypothetical protein BAUCODRAFT_32228 [Baudoinia panamericana UAMH 10762]|uniref:Uncharacterized protein n=1 Tax=Baudoinia panamericana (strain UAMH 10762) TaxID=717646 RepID=M2MNH6_BAUPA|nr:uncharacterized protein BAUCODRAFT_32228 [Baudoinia panamericana UAMH 10762]EMC98241.1 hypothetical protein BAUCODRAFT_32228 [Baudoinia panamericana UAMH 10762]
MVFSTATSPRMRPSITAGLRSKEPYHPHFRTALRNRGGSESHSGCSDTIAKASSLAFVWHADM